MRISQLYIYPIKSLRAVPISTAHLTAHGFLYDRRFMLFKIQEDGSKSPLSSKLEKMTVTYFSELALFSQAIHLPQASATDNQNKSDGDGDTGTVTVTFSPPNSDRRQITLSLGPSTEELEELDVALHGSPTKAFSMGTTINDWFSDCFGYKVLLAYIGSHRRPILGNLAPGQVEKEGKSTPQATMTQSKSWLGSVADYLTPPTTAPNTTGDDGLTFTDCAPYLVITEESLQEVSSMLPAGVDMDVTKFRANIVLTGSLAAYDEDFWGAVTVRGEGDVSTVITLTQNCLRCRSLDVNYKTGKFGVGDTEQVLKKLMKDRRVDQGKKYSPVFGRYGFLVGEAMTINIGDTVAVTKRNKERTSFYWPGL